MSNSNGFDNKNNDFDLNNNNLTGKLFSKMVIAAANELDKNRDYIDSLNVFPVPDGDTGTNMSLTILAAAQEIKNLDSDNISCVAKKAAEGALKGARGNSGVILSQLFRGFSKGLENLESASNHDLAFACSKAYQMAYKAVMKPKEGTILTLSREIAESFSQEILNYERLEDAMMATIVHSKKILEKTKDMLPQLRQANVVDSGARGLLFILEGALKALDDKINFDFDLEFNAQEKNNIKKNSPAQSNFDTSEIDFCYEVLLDINNISENNLDDFKAFLNNIGDSLVITNGDEFIRIHVHTNEPGKIINKAFAFCDLFNARFENLKSQHEQIIKNQDLGPKKNIGFIAVCMGSGFIELFKSLGVDQIIDGGKLMNPSTQDIINAIKKINADKIIILPNDKNVIMAAKQAAELCDDKKIIILETKTIPQGLAALLNYIPDDNNNNFDEDQEFDKSKLEETENNIINQMQEAINLVKTGQITYAASDTEIDNIKITQGDFLGTIESNVVLCEKNLETAVISLIDLLVKNNNSAEILTLYYGEDITQDQTNNILDYINKKYPDLETEVHNGNQPLYFYIISLE